MNRGSATAERDAVTLVEELVALVEAVAGQRPYGDAKEALKESVFRILIGKTA